MRLSDAGVCRRQTKLLYPNHRPPSWPNEDSTLRLLEPIGRRATAHGGHISYHGRSKR